MIDNEKVKNALAGWAKFPIYSKTETDFFDQCGHIGNFSRNEVITFYAGYAAGGKEAGEEKQEMLDALKFVISHDRGNLCEDCRDNCIMLIEKHTGKPIDEVIG